MYKLMHTDKQFYSYALISYTTRNGLSDIVQVELCRSQEAFIRYDSIIKQQIYSTCSLIVSKPLTDLLLDDRPMK